LLAVELSPYRRYYRYLFYWSYVAFYHRISFVYHSDGFEGFEEAFFRLSISFRVITDEQLYQNNGRTTFPFIVSLWLLSYLAKKLAKIKYTLIKASK
jgi:hypothetical protein